MKGLFAGTVLLTLISYGISSCKHTPLFDPTDPTFSENCDPDTVYFQTDILPLIISNCAKSGCHGEDHDEDAEEMTSYEKIMNSDYIEAFNADDSDMIEALTDDDEDERMPPEPNEPLTSSQINMIKKWINQGARNNNCSVGCDTTNVTYSGTIVPLINTYCIGCHGATGNTSGVVLTNYEGTGSNSGVEDIAADGSFLGVVNHEDGYIAMPFGGTKIPDCKIDEIRIWIENGFPND